MKEPIEIESLEPKLSEPTEEEIKKVIKEFKEKFNKKVSGTDAVHYAKLRNELGYWLQIEKESEKEGCTTKAMAKETMDLFKNKRGEKITLERSYLETKKLMIIAIADAKIRITNEIKTIINKYK